MAVKKIEWEEVLTNWGKDIVDDIMRKMTFLVKDGGEPWRAAFEQAKAEWEKNGIKFEPEQEERIAGVVARLTMKGDTPFAGIVGQPGVGKTLISAGVCKTMSIYNNSNRIVFLTPGGVIKGAQEEYTKIFGSPNIVEASVDGDGYFHGLETVALKRGFAVQCRGADGVKSFLKALGWKGRIAKTGSQKIDICGEQVQVSVINKTVIFYSNSKEAKNSVRLTLGEFDGWMLEKKAETPEIILVARDATKFNYGTGEDLQRQGG